MIIHNLKQRSPEWYALLRETDGASEASAMLGLSKKTTRSELLHMKHTGSEKEFSEWVQKNILDYGHEVEALARPLIELIIGEDLYAVTCSEGRMRASCDGLNMEEDHGWEHKQWNAKLAAAVARKELPEEFMAQPQQCLMVTKAKVWTFTVSDGTTDNMVSMDILPDPVWFERIRSGWEQFRVDLAAYVPKELAEKPLADAIMQLPALSIQLKGEVTVSNLPQFKAAAQTFIANIKTDLQTDEDFANAEATVKFCGDTEKKLELARASALSQTASIDDLMRTIDYIKEELRGKRLSLEKLVTQKKEAIKTKIVADAKHAFLNHVNALYAEIKPIELVTKQPDFAAAAKNKRTLASLHDAVDSELANAKITADAIAKDIRGRIQWLKETQAGHEFLFNDLQQIIYKTTDDFRLLVQTRIAHHKAAEEKNKPLSSRWPFPESVDQIPPSLAQAELELESANARTISVLPIRPTDMQIVETLARSFNVSEKVALQWIYDFDGAGIARRTSDRESA